MLLVICLPKIYESISLSSPPTLLECKIAQFLGGKRRLSSVVI